MAEHVATLERNNVVLLERLNALESKQDTTLKVIESGNKDNEQIDTLINEIKKLNEKIETLEAEQTQKKKLSLLAKLFKK
ncbi:hypothetical protein [Rummeliibacillus sp. TYF005]|uniref:hypothetical protein n=1 Tax=Rummeliibacillus sp. TYF005 TaxID=2058214 RepID=UPI000F520060|nr:hypothetical protein [Rummeliibacillus sp. TYF005]